MPPARRRTNAGHAAGRDHPLAIQTRTISSADGWPRAWTGNALTVGRGDRPAAASSRALGPAVVQGLLAGRRARAPVGPVDPRLRAQAAVAVGALLERPAAVQRGGEPARQGAEAAGAEDEPRPARSGR